MVEDLKVGDIVYVHYKDCKKKILTGFVDKIYMTTFGSKVKDLGVSIFLHNPHPLTKKRRTTFRITRVRRLMELKQRGK